jgi:arylsulfatase A-like enzyme
MRPILLGFAAWASAGIAALGEEPAGRPNILFMFTDDHACHAIGAYGSKINETPNLDRLAREGMRFDRCLVTNSICGPSRAVILTGKHSHLNGLLGNKNTFDGSQQTAPKLLREAGYETAIIGKWHLKSTPTGFDHFDVLIGQGNYYNTRTRTTGATGEVMTIPNEGYTTDVITDKALAWLGERDAGKPFFLMYQHKAPHGKWEPAVRHLDLYADRDIPEPKTLLDNYEGRARGAADNEQSLRFTFGPDRGHWEAPPGLTPGEFTAWHRVYDPTGAHDARWLKDGATRYAFQNTAEKSRGPKVMKSWTAAFGPRNRELWDAKLEGDELLRWKYQRYIKNYLRCVTAVDENIGRMLDYLDESGLAENTIVIYSSDQGFYLGDHGWFDKRWIYEPSLRTPLIVRWPGVVPPGSASGDLVSNLDFASTFLDIAGAVIPDDLQGASLVPVMKGQTPDNWRESFYYHYYEGDYPNPQRKGHNVPRHYGVVTDRHKLVHYYQLGEWELFDLERDPDEMRSQFNNPDYGAVRKELGAELQRLRKHYRVPEKDPPGAGT